MSHSFYVTPFGGLKQLKGQLETKLKPKTKTAEYTSPQKGREKKRGTTSKILKPKSKAKIDLGLEELFSRYYYAVIKENEKVEETKSNESKIENKESDEK